MLKSLTLILILVLVGSAESQEQSVRLRLQVTSSLPYQNTPLDPRIDFAKWIRSSGLRGVVDTNSITVINRSTGEPVPHGLAEDLAYSESGRIEFVVADPMQRDFEIRFQVVI